MSDQKPTGVGVAAATPNLYQRLNAVCSEVAGIPKTTGRGVPYAFHGHNEVTLALRGLLIKHGVDQSVSVAQCESLDDKRIRVKCVITWRNVDTINEMKQVEAWGEGPTGGKAGAQPQHLGSAISYAVKYALEKNFLLTSEDPNIEEYRDGYAERPAAYPDPAPPQPVAQAVARAGTPDSVSAKLQALADVQDKPAFDALVTQCSQPGFYGQLSTAQRHGLTTAMDHAAKRIGGSS